MGASIEAIEGDGSIHCHHQHPNPPHTKNGQTKYIPEFKGLRVIKNATSGSTVETVPLKRPMTVRVCFFFK